MIKTWLKNKVLCEKRGISENGHEKTFIERGPTNLREHDVADDMQLAR
jgi:hypothetical protein